MSSSNNTTMLSLLLLPPSGGGDVHEGAEAARGDGPRGFARPR